MSAAPWSAGDGWEELTQPDKPSLLHSPTTKQSLQEVYDPALTLLGVMQEGSISKHHPPNCASLCCRPALPGSQPAVGWWAAFQPPGVQGEEPERGRTSVIPLPGR